MTNLEKLITSEYLYPLWRVGWVEKAFFLACRKLSKQQAQKLFTDAWRGHDVSYYQGFIDFLEMLASGAKFVIIRCGYGTTKDVKFDEYMRDVEGILPTSIYHYYDPTKDPIAQANKVIEILEPYMHRVRRVWGDLEFTWTGAYKDPVHWKTYKDVIKARLAYGWYSRQTWWDSRVGIFATEFGEDPAWAAQYSPTFYLLMKGFARAMLWQNGALPVKVGQDSPTIDHNYWNTDYNFDAEWGGITPPPIGGVMLYGKINTTALNVRAGYNSTFPIIGQVVKDDYVIATETASGWWHLTEAYRGSWNGAPIALSNGTLINDAPNAWCSGAYILTVEPPVPPPPPPPPVTVKKEIRMDLPTGAVVEYLEDGVVKWKVTA